MSTRQERADVNPIGCDTIWEVGGFWPEDADAWRRGYALGYDGPYVVLEFIDPPRDVFDTQEAVALFTPHQLFPWRQQA